MKRFTHKIKNEKLYIIKETEIVHQEEGYVGEAVNRLAAYENMYEALMAEQEKVSKELEALRLEGKTKTVTFKQLIAKKLTNSNILSLFDVYGI